MASFSATGELDIGYKGTMFEKPICKFQIDTAIPNGDTPEETKMIEAAFKKLWDAGLAKLNKLRAATIKKAMDDTEKAMAKKPMSKEAMEAFVKTANKMIEQGVDVWSKVEIPKLAQDCISKVYDAVEAKLKKKVTRQQVKCVFKVIALVLITLAVAAAGIAATVLTGGALAVVVLASIGTGVGAIISTVKIIKKEYDSYNGILDKITADLAELDKAVAYQKKKEKDSKARDLGPKEKIKLLLAGTAPIVKKLEKHLDEAEGKLILARKANNEAVVKANELQAEFDKMSTTSDPTASKEAKEAKALAYRAAREVEKFEEKKKAFEDMKAQAKKAIAEIEKNGEWNGGNLPKLVAFCQAHQESVSFLIDATKSLVTSLGKIKKALNL